ncbi:hypothetical protein KKI17_02000, partial [Patescibacteria group bacterium]|nr:hypothetical protein [Patescibacteria group bacterium]
YLATNAFVLSVWYEKAPPEGRFLFSRGILGTGFLGELLGETGFHPDMCEAGLHTFLATEN